MALPRELHADLVNPALAAPVVTMVLNFTESADADITLTFFAASRKMKLIGASYVQSIDAQAATSYTATLQNGATAMTAALDIKALADDVSAQFVVLSTKDADLAKGDILSLVLDETGGTATSPEDVWIQLTFQLLT